MIYENSNKESLLKLVDFGTSRVFEDNQLMYSKTGTVNKYKKIIKKY